MRSFNGRLLRLIAAFKFLKAALLIALAVGVFKAVHKDFGQIAEHWVGALGLDPGNHYIDAFLTRISRLRPEQIKKLGVGSLIYAGLFLTEGIGLWMLKAWAEWFTTILTSTLIPIEIYEIYRHPTVIRVLALAINVAIVVYLIHRIRSRKSGALA
jgi:uncharacterized membrane protein (DUF2068 family)